MTRCYSKLVGLLGLLPSVAFADMAKEGTFDFISCYSATYTVTKFSDTHSLVSYENTGIVRSAVPDGPFDKDTFHCIGVELVVDKKVANDTTLCESMDKDGNKRLSRYSNNDGKITREQLGGTGKYDGLTMTLNAIESLGPFPRIKAGTSQNCNHQKGTYKLK